MSHEIGRGTKSNEISISMEKHEDACENTTMTTKWNENVRENHEVKRNEIKWNEIKQSEAKWKITCTEITRGMKSNPMKLNESKSNEMKWTAIKWNNMLKSYELFQDEIISSNKRSEARGEWHEIKRIESTWKWLETKCHISDEAFWNEITWIEF